MTKAIARREFTRLSLIGSILMTGAARAAISEQSKELPKETGPQWRKLDTVPYKGKQDDIAFADADFGFYGNGEGKLYRTSDGGSSWQKIWDQPGTFIRALGIIDRENGFLGNVGVDYYPGVTDKNPLYRTRDGGVTWTVITAPGIDKVTGICGIHILPVKRIYQGEMRTSHIVHAAGRVGGPAMLMRSEDSGDSWRVIDISAHAGMILDVHFITPKLGFIAAASPSDTGEGEARILRTTDGGKTWAAVYKSGRSKENCWKMSWPAASTGYATVQSYDEDPAKTQRVVIKTTNGGKSWRELPLVKDKAAQEFGIGFADADHGWVGTRTGGFETRDGGKSWQKAEIGIAANKIRVLTKPQGGNRAFAIGVNVHRLDF
jgi:photosystem II stability/assembly factor-like uncharacterized protein